MPQWPEHGRAECSACRYSYWQPEHATGLGADIRTLVSTVSDPDLHTDEAAAFQSDETAKFVSFAPSEHAAHGFSFATTGAEPYWEAVGGAVVSAQLSAVEGSEIRCAHRAAV